MKYKSFVISSMSVIFAGVLLIPTTSYALDMEWKEEGGKSYWYEGGVRQGTYDDEKCVLGDGTKRGREIYDPESDAWYWLDAVYDGAKAVNKEVWLPYVFQNEDDFDEKTINQLSRFGRSPHIAEAIKNKEGKWVRYDENGAMIKGLITIGGPKYIEGRLAELYPEQVGNTYYYDDKTGQMVKGWATRGNGLGLDVKYYFDPVSGKMMTGEVEIDGQDYFFDSKGGLLESLYRDDKGILKVKENTKEKIIDSGKEGNISWWIIGIPPRAFSGDIGSWALVISGVCDENDAGFKNIGYLQNSNHLYSVEQAFVDIRNANDLSYLFCNMHTLKYIYGLDKLDTSKVTDMSRMFYGCNMLKQLDVSNFDTSNVTDMSEMFANLGCLLDLDLSNFDTGNVTDMHGMFSSEPCFVVGRALANRSETRLKLDISGFDTSKVTDMSNMFNTSYIEEIDLSSFDTSNVKDMSNMFAYEFSSDYPEDQTGVVQNIYVGSGWVIGEDTKTDNMFDRCGVDGVTVK